MDFELTERRRQVGAFPPPTVAGTDIPTTVAAARANGAEGTTNA